MKIEEIKAYKCPVCGNAYVSEKAAERCCQPKKCERCGIEIPRKSYYCLCESCRKIAKAEEEKKRFEKAVKYKLSECPPEKCEMMFSDIFGHNEGYFIGVDELEDYCYDNNIEMPKYCYGTYSRQISFDACSIIESACDDLHEDAIDQIDDASVKELQNFLDAWCEKQTGTKTYYADYTCAILLGE